MNLNGISQATWTYNAHEKKVVRTKKISTAEVETTVYSLGTRLGDQGGWNDIFNLIPDDPTKKTKVIKIKRKGVGSRVTPAREFGILSILPKSEGLSLPPKGFVKGRIILAKYDCTLDSMLPSMTPRMKIEAIQQLVNGLTALHAAGICHCDIRFPNIMCRTKKDKTRYDLIDFGEAWAYKNETIVFDEGVFNEERYLEDKQKDILQLGLKLYSIVMGNEECKFTTLSHEFMKSMDLPPSFADAINYMCERGTDMDQAKLMLTSGS